MGQITCKIINYISITLISKLNKYITITLIFICYLWFNKITIELSIYWKRIHIRLFMSELSSAEENWTESLWFYDFLWTKLENWACCNKKKLPNWMHLDIRNKMDKTRTILIKFPSFGNRDFVKRNAWLLHVKGSSLLISEQLPIETLKRRKGKLPILKYLTETNLKAYSVKNKIFVISN